MSKIIELPIIVCGKIKMPKEDFIELKYSGDVIVRITRPSKEDFQEILDYNEDLNSINFADLVTYITKCATAFRNEDYPIRKEAIELSSYITGYTRQMLARDYDVISEHLAKRYNLYDMVTAELGNYRIMDEWVRNELAKVRAFPRGRTFHILVGNVPMTGIFSVLRSIITKNQTVVKLPSRDLVSTLFFMRALIDCNQGDERFQNMLSRSLSAFYIEKDSNEFTQIIEASDMVCAWGKGGSLKQVKEKIPHSIPYLEFGPKRSFSLLYADECMPDGAAVRMAHDLCLYDQEACLSPQRLFIIGDYKKFIPALEKWLNWQSKYLPRGFMNDDAESHLYRIKLEAKYAQMQVSESPEGQWRIIVCNPYDVQEHPLGRTLFIHPIKSEEEILPFVDDETQCISVFPYVDHMEKLGDLLCARGVSKLCETGMAIYPREGWTHDAMYPLHYFVRLCYIDVSSEYQYKYDPDEEEGLACMSQMFGNITDEDLEELLKYYLV